MDRIKINSTNEIMRLVLVSLVIIGFNTVLAQSTDLAESMYAQSMSLSPDGKTLAVFVGLGNCLFEEGVERYYETRLIDMETDTLIHTLHGHQCPAQPIWSPDGSRLITRGRDLTRVWDVATWQEIAWMNDSSGLFSASWRPDGQRIASIETGFVFIYDANTGEYLQDEIIRIPEAIWSVAGMWSAAWHPSDSDLIATGFADGTVRLWSQSGELRNTLKVSTSRIGFLSWSPNGTYLLARDDETSITLIDADLPRIARVFSWPDNTAGIQNWSDDSSLIVVIGNNGQIRVWDIVSGDLVEFIEVPGKAINSAEIRSSANGSYELFYITSPDFSKPISDTGIQTHPFTVNRVQSIIGFILVDADADEDLRPLEDGETITEETITIRVETEPPIVGSVVFGLDEEPRFKVENEPAYALKGDDNGDYHAWLAEPGTYTLTATPYTEADGGGEAGTPLTITFTVEAPGS